MKDGNEEIESLEERILGRYARQTMAHPETGDILVVENELITEEVTRAVIESGLTEFPIRSVFNCNSKHGVCRKCYGRNLATGREVEVGEAVGIVCGSINW